MTTAHSILGKRRRQRHLRQLVNREIARWNAGAAPDARKFIDQHPDLHNQCSLLVDLAYDEFCRRFQGQGAFAIQTYARDFPEIRQQLERQLHMHYMLDDMSQLNESPSPDIDWPQPGETAMGLELLSELGRGGFSRVFLAQQTSVGNRLVAVKVGPHGQQEAHTLGALQHPHIVPIHSIQKDERGLTWMCMPYLGRATLSDVLSHTSGNSQRDSATTILDAVSKVNSDRFERQLETEDVASFDRLSYVEGMLRIVEGIGQALQHLHSQGIRHQDLKPSNILITQSGEPRLLDFNLAVPVNDSGGKVGGTLPYMSPEQLRLACGKADDATRIDERSDIYSFGLLAFELFTGALPNNWASSLDGLESRRDQAEEIYDARLARRHIEWPDGSLCGYGLRRMISRCLSHDPDQRPSSMDEVLAAIRSERRLTTRIARALRSAPRLTACLTILTSLVLLVVLTASLRQEPSADTRLQAAETSLKGGNVELAMQLLNEILTDSPNARPALALRLRASLGLADHDLALRDAAALYETTQPGRHHALRAFILSRTGNNAVAKEQYLAALKLGYDPFWVRFNLAVLTPENHTAMRSILNEGRRVRPDSYRIAANHLVFHRQRCAEAGEWHPPFAALYAHLESLGNPRPTTELCPECGGRTILEACGVVTHQRIGQPYRDRNVSAAYFSLAPDMIEDSD